MTTTHLRFDNEEVNEIQDLLESCGNDETMDIGVIDGFFTALSVLKNPRPDEVVIPYLFSVTGDAAPSRRTNVSSSSSRFAATS